jgi:hypothetical protein
LISARSSTSSQPLPESSTLYFTSPAGFVAQLKIAGFIGVAGHAGDPLVYGS